MMIDKIRSAVLSLKLKFAHQSITFGEKIHAGLMAMFAELLEGPVMDKTGFKGAVKLSMPPGWNKATDFGKLLGVDAVTFVPVSVRISTSGVDRAKLYMGFRFLGSNLDGPFTMIVSIGQLRRYGGEKCKVAFENELESNFLVLSTGAKHRVAAFKAFTNESEREKLLGGDFQGLSSWRFLTEGQKEAIALFLYQEVSFMFPLPEAVK